MHPDTTARYNFYSESWYRIKGRGFVATIIERLPYGLWTPNQLVGLNITIDNEPFIVKGVEAFMIGCSPNNPYKLQFAILV